MKPYFEQDGITIYHGDCREILPTIGRVDCTVTSPPYNQLGDMPETPTGMWAQTNGGSGFPRIWRSAGYSDSMDEYEYQEWQRETFSAIAWLTNPTGSLFYNHQVRWRDGKCLHPLNWFYPTDWHLRQEIIWDRGGGMMMNARMFVRYDERILWFVRGDRWKWNQESVGHGTIWRIAREQQQQGKEHPVAYPIEIPKRCIAAATDPGDVVLDPFMGSGTTLRAAKDLGRKAIGIELEEKWCEVAAKRMSQSVLPLYEGWADTGWMVKSGYVEEK